MISHITACYPTLLFFIFSMYSINFTLPSASNAKIEVYNLLGKLVATPFDGMAEAGGNSIEWDGKNSTGQTVSSGIYFYRLTSDKYNETKKMTLLK